MRHGQNWPDRLWLVRHGQSQGNVARDAAHEAGLSIIDLDIRDVDVPLSDLGHRQAEATGRWFASLPEAERPEVIISSPYIRARQTAEILCAELGIGTAVLRFIDGLYNATGPALVAELRRHAEGTDLTLMLVAHNPGISDVARRLSGDPQACGFAPADWRAVPLP